MGCKYCDKKCFGDFCGHDCEKKYNKISTLAEKYKSVYLLGLLGPTILTIPASFIFPGHLYFFVAAVFFIMAITLMVLPFVTRETVSALGVKKSITAVRLTAIFLFLIGLIVLPLTS